MKRVVFRHATAQSDGALQCTPLLDQVRSPHDCHSGSGFARSQVSSMVCVTEYFQDSMQGLRMPPMSFGLEGRREGRNPPPPLPLSPQKKSNPSKERKTSKQQKTKKEEESESARREGNQPPQTQPPPLPPPSSKPVSAAACKVYGSNSIAPTGRRLKWRPWFITRAREPAANDKSGRSTER